jgi:hypothetical protein
MHLNHLGHGALLCSRCVDALIVPIIGIVLLVGGVIYPNRVKQKEAVTK